MKTQVLALLLAVVIAAVSANGFGAGTALIGEEEALVGNRHADSIDAQQSRQELERLRAEKRHRRQERRRARQARRARRKQAVEAQKAQKVAARQNAAAAEFKNLQAERFFDVNYDKKNADSFVVNIARNTANSESFSAKGGDRLNDQAGARVATNQEVLAQGQESVRALDEAEVEAIDEADLASDYQDQVGVAAEGGLNDQAALRARSQGENLARGRQGVRANQQGFVGK